jgi:hypothetical protein
MEKIKDTQRIKQILEKGEVTFKDPETGYKYKLCAVCPVDDHECSLANFEKEIGTASKIIRVTFYCPICNTRFDAGPDDLFLR